MMDYRYCTNCGVSHDVGACFPCRRTQQDAMAQLNTELLTAILAGQHRVERKLDDIIKQEQDEMATLNDLVANEALEDQAISDAVARVQTSTDDLKAQIKALTPDPDAQAKIDALFAAQQSQIATLATVAAAATPPAAA